MHAPPLHHLPESVDVRRAGDDEHALAAHEEARQRAKRLRDLILVDAHLVEPEQRHAAVVFALEFVDGLQRRKSASTVRS
jgi:hypothetical protein